MARKSSRMLNTSSGRVPLGEPLYDFHFHLRNTGRSTAESVTATIVEFWYEDQSGDLVQLGGFLPVPLRYLKSEIVDIHPKRPYYWNVGYLPSRRALKKLPMPPRFDAPGKQSSGLAFWLDLEGAPWYQVNALASGTYGIKIMLHSKNAAAEPIYLKISWTGRWRSTEASMFKQIRIEQVHKLP